MSERSTSYAKLLGMGLINPEDLLKREQAPFTPLVMTPEQIRGASRATSPEINLRAAVLEDAIVELRKYRGQSGRAARRMIEETTRWFRSSDTSWPMAFQSICDVLGFDASAIRSKLGVV